MRVSCLGSVGLALGHTHHAFTADFIHSCLQFHPPSSRPRHAGWTSLFLHHHLTPSPSDSLSPSSSQAYSFLGQGRTLPLAKLALPVSRSPASPFSSGSRHLRLRCLNRGCLPPSLSSHRHPSGRAPHNGVGEAWGFLTVVGLEWLVCLGGFVSWVDPDPRAW